MEINYQYIKSYQEDNELIKNYFDFTQQIFSFDLQKWKNAGYWTDNYVPHSLISNNKIISNISASIMQLQINGKHIQAIQLGSVGVLPDYRGKGFSRMLMERVFDEYSDYPLIFLFASDDVSEFYKKFGFRRIDEIFPVMNVLNKFKKVNPINIPLESEQLKRILNSKLQYSSIIDARGNISIHWYHLMYQFSKDIYYIEENDIIFIAKYKNDMVDLFDVLSVNKVSFDEIEKYILKDTTKQVRFHFTPDWLNVNYDVIPRKDKALYVYGEFLNNMSNCIFPEIGTT